MKPNNPPAFPSPHITNEAYGGMTLRDYFANSAMLGIVACPTEPSIRQCADSIGIKIEDYCGDRDWPKAVAAQSYKIADAMLLERSKRND